ncbi:MAG: PQQ-like beta-propeller repeat protein [Ignavibacteriae bacterium]|nr:PQQ-like beta-propeller repeat protein [Ignavibacteriota bacterium]
MNKHIKVTIILLLFIFGNIFAQTPGTVNWEFQTRGNEITSPAIDDDGTIYFGSSDSSLYALNSDGTKKWEFKTGGIITSSPAIGNNGTIYFGSHDRKLYAINPDGTKKWDYETGWKIYYAPAIGEDETIYIKSDDSYLYAFNSDGYLKWTYLYSSYESGENKDFFSSAIIDDDGIIYPVNPIIGNSFGLNPNGTENEKIIPQVEKYFKGVIDNDSNYCMRKSDSHGEGEDRFWLKLRDKNGSGGWSNDSYLYYPIIGND